MIKNKELREVIYDLNNKLNMANNTVALQIEEINKLNGIASSLQRSRSSCYEEIENQKIIIRYLEDKLGLKGDTDEL